MQNTDPSIKNRISELRQIFSNELRIEIVLILFMNTELSLNEITKYSGKSKSAISRQMKKLTELEIIESFEKNEVRPGLQQKYFRINNSFKDLFQYLSPDNLTGRKNIQKELLEKYFFYTIALNETLPFLQKLNDKLLDQTIMKLDSERTGPKSNELIDLGFLFIPEHSIEEFKKITTTYVKSIINLSSNSNNKTKSYLCTLMVQPLELMLKQREINEAKSS